MGEVILNWKHFLTYEEQQTVNAFEYLQAETAKVWKGQEDIVEEYHLTIRRARQRARYASRAGNHKYRAADNGTGGE